MTLLIISYNEVNNFLTGQILRRNFQIPYLSIIPYFLVHNYFLQGV